MKITKLDDFDNGFKSAPRKPHKAATAIKCSKHSKGHGITLATMQHKLQTQEQVFLTEFERPDAAKNAVYQLRFRGMKIKVIKEGRKAIGYQLIEQ